MSCDVEEFLLFSYLFDLSVIFKTIDHTVLSRRLEHSCDVTGSALTFVYSYHDRSVRVGGALSNIEGLDTGVPQESSLCPQLFSLFATKLCDLISRYGLKLQQYADDTQIDIAVNGSNLV